MGRVIELQINYPDDLDVDPFKFWSVNSILHREDGFAVYYGTGAGAYYLNGRLIADERFKHVLRRLKNERRTPTKAL